MFCHLVYCDSSSSIDTSSASSASSPASCSTLLRLLLDFFGTFPIPLYPCPLHSTGSSHTTYVPRASELVATAGRSLDYAPSLFHHHPTALAHSLVRPSPSPHPEPPSPTPRVPPPPPPSPSARITHPLPIRSSLSLRFRSLRPPHRTLYPPSRCLRLLSNYRLFTNCLLLSHGYDPLASLCLSTCLLISRLH